MLAEPGELSVVTSEAGTDGSVIGDAAAEQVADERFDGVGFVEGHIWPPITVANSRFLTVARSCLRFWQCSEARSSSVKSFAMRV